MIQIDELSRRKALSQRKNQPIFILWSEGFDETAVVLFVSELRKMGLYTKIVGLAGQKACGKNGVIVYADVTLSEALLLASQVVCVAIPCTLTSWLRAENDPRVEQFLLEAIANNPYCVIRGADAMPDRLSHQFIIPAQKIKIYRHVVDLIDIAQDIANSILGEG